MAQLDDLVTTAPSGAPPVPSGQVAAPFYVVGDVDGDVDTLYGNAGTFTHAPSVLVDRQLASNAPFNSADAPTLAKLTHFRAPGMGDAMWSGQCVYDSAGATPGFSYYDDPNGLAADDGLSEAVSAGVVRYANRQPVHEPTTTRDSRVAAHYDSAPAAGFFQGYWNPRWSGLLSGFRPQVQPRPLHMNFNAGQMGSKELHKATQYKPVPPMGAIVGYFGTEKAL